MFDHDSVSHYRKAGDQRTLPVNYVALDDYIAELWLIKPRPSHSSSDSASILSIGRMFLLLMGIQMPTSRSGSLQSVSAPKGSITLSTQQKFPLKVQWLLLSKLGGSMCEIQCMA